MTEYIGKNRCTFIYTYKYREITDSNVLKHFKNKYGVQQMTVYDVIY